MLKDELIDIAAHIRAAIKTGNETHWSEGGARAVQVLLAEQAARLDKLSVPGEPVAAEQPSS